MKLRLRLPMLHCAVLCVAGSFSLPAFSDDSARNDLLKVLLDRGAISSSEYEELKSSASAEPNVRFMANYVRASTDPTSPEKFASVGDEDVNIFQVRSQIDF